MALKLASFNLPSEKDALEDLLAKLTAEQLVDLHYVRAEGARGINYVIAYIVYKQK